MLFGRRQKIHKANKRPREQDPELEFFERAYANSLVLRVMGSSGKQVKPWNRHDQRQFQRNNVCQRNWKLSWHYFAFINAAKIEPDAGPSSVTTEARQTEQNLRNMTDAQQRQAFDNGETGERPNAVSRTRLDRKPNTPYPVSSRWKRPKRISDPTPCYPRKRKASRSPDRQDITDNLRASDPKPSATEAEYRVLHEFKGTKPWQGT